MKAFSLCASLLISILIYGQENEKTDFFSEIKKHDISHLLTLEHFFIEDSTFFVIRPQPLGFIGENFQRIYIRFISVIKNPSEPTEYMVYGKTKIKNKISTFQGKLTIKKSEIYNANEHPTRTSEYHFLSKKNSDLQQGVIFGEYTFYQNPKDTGAGILKGDFVSHFFLNRESNPAYDILMWNADDYRNNQFKGQWISYETGESKKCNWGDFRIPNCGDLDVGTAEFSPNKKYLKAGWENYQVPVSQSKKKNKMQKKVDTQEEKWWANQ